MLYDDYTDEELAAEIEDLRSQIDTAPSGEWRHGAWRELQRLRREQGRRHVND